MGADRNPRDSAIPAGVAPGRGPPGPLGEPPAATWIGMGPTLSGLAGKRYCAKGVGCEGGDVSGLWG
jgi:hypothetical protein